MKTFEKSKQYRNKFYANIRFKSQADKSAGINYSEADKYHRIDGSETKNTGWKRI